MKQLYFSYEAPETEVVEAKLSEMLCQSSGGTGSEDFTDGNWEW